MINYFLTDRIAGEEVEVVSDRIFMARSSASLSRSLNYFSDGVRSVC